MHNLKQLRDQAPNKKNGSPQFPDDGIDAHSAHTGRKGQNKIDYKYGANIGQAMLDHLEAGDFELVSASPTEYADPAKLQTLVDEVLSGKAKQTKIETTSIAEDGKPRTKRLVIDLTGASIPRIEVVWRLPQKA